MSCQPLAPPLLSPGPAQARGTCLADPSGWEVKPGSWPRGTRGLGQGPAQHSPYLAVLAHPSDEERVLQGDVEAPAGDADIWARRGAGVGRLHWVLSPCPPTISQHWLSLHPAAWLLMLGSGIQPGHGYTGVSSWLGAVGVPSYLFLPRMLSPDTAARAGPLPAPTPNPGPCRPNWPRSAPCVGANRPCSPGCESHCCHPYTIPVAHSPRKAAGEGLGGCLGPSLSRGCTHPLLSAAGRAPGVGRQPLLGAAPSHPAPCGPAARGVPARCTTHLRCSCTSAAPRTRAALGREGSMQSVG